MHFRSQTTGESVDPTKGSKTILDDDFTLQVHPYTCPECGKPVKREFAVKMKDEHHTYGLHLYCYMKLALEGPRRDVIRKKP